MTGVMVAEGEKASLLKIPDGQELIFNHEWLRKLQDRFLIVFKDMMGKVEHLSDYEERTWRKYTESKTINGIAVSNSFDIALKIEAKVFGPFEYDKKTDETKIRWSRDWIEQSSFTSEAHPTSDQFTMFIYGFLKCLSGVPTNAFRRCEECESWYFHLSRRKRQFCNNLCAARSANRVRRAKAKNKIPKEYKKEMEKNRERARKSYENKVKKVHPDARIRRNRKKSI